MIQVSGRAMLASIFVLVAAAGCEKVEIPSLTESGSKAPNLPTAEPDSGKRPSPVAAKQPVPVRHGNAAAGQPCPTPTAEPGPSVRPSAASVLASINAKPSLRVTDQDLRKFSGIDEGLETVTELKLTGATLSAAGLEVLATLPALKKLDLEHARIRDADWSGLAGATTLESLNLKKSSIRNTTMSALSGMTNLKLLDISDTRVTDLGFKHLAKLSALEHLVVESLNIEGNGMQELGRKGANAPLRTIHASQTTFGRLGFIYLREFDDLEELYVTAASVSNNSLSGLSRVTTLRRVSLAGNPLVTDAGLKFLRKSRQLEYLELSGVWKISDETLKGFSKHRNLKELRINDSLCTLDGVVAFKNSVPRCTVYLRGEKH
ncbi:MAG: hypothetical protein MK110_05450 [Fuerstiella sp.]|nr:hypothetical protein [Fuerstiella sp.]